MDKLENTPRYAIAEIERRWLVDASVLGQLAHSRCRRFEDLYLHNSRLRLRKITELGANTLYKLGKKYGKKSILSEPITTLYLDEAEYNLLRKLPGSASSKQRYTIAGGSLDVYEQPISGTMIFELEFESEDAARSYQPPTFVTKEVTNEPEYSGFKLAQNSQL